MWPKWKDHSGLLSMCITEETMSSRLAAGLLKFDPYETLTLVTTLIMPDGRFNLVDVALQPLRSSSTIVLDSRMKGFASAAGIRARTSIMEQHVAILWKVPASLFSTIFLFVNQHFQMWGHWWKLIAWIQTLKMSEQVCVHHNVWWFKAMLELIISWSTNRYLTSSRTSTHVPQCSGSLLQQHYYDCSSCRLGAVCLQVAIYRITFRSDWEENKVHCHSCLIMWTVVARGSGVVVIIELFWCHSKCNCSSIIVALGWTYRLVTWERDTSANSSRALNQSVTRPSANQAQPDRHTIRLVRVMKRSERMNFSLILLFQVSFVVLLVLNVNITHFSTCWTI